MRKDQYEICLIPLGGYQNRICLGIGWMNISGQHITNMHNNRIKIYIDLNCVFMLIGWIVSVIQGYGRKEEKF